MKEIKASGSINMLSGPLAGRMILFALPLIATGILQQSFNSVDIAVVGHFSGPHALAAVGCTGPVIGLLINLFVGMSVGVNVVIANYIGQRSGEGVRRAVSAAMILALICGVAMLALGLGLSRPVLELLGTPEDVMDDALLYMRVFVLGLPLMLVYNFGAAVLRSVGDTRRPFYCLVAAGIINVAFNLLFVVVMDMGVIGVAWGTVISNAVNAGAIIVILMREQGDIHLNIRKLAPNPVQLKKIVAIGLPAGLQGAVFAFSNTLILSSINTFGPDCIAGSSAAVNFEFYCYFVMSGFSQTAVAFISQNYGAGNTERIRRIFRISLLWAAVTTLALNFLVLWLRGPFMSIFTSDTTVAEFGYTRIEVVLMFQWIATFYEVAACAMRGMGRSMLPTLIVIGGTCVLRVFWVFLFPMFGSTFGELMLVYPCSWILTDVMMAIAYRHVWKQVLKEVRA